METVIKIKPVRRTENGRGTPLQVDAYEKYFSRGLEFLVHR
jgi:hypothetical protein